jgi:arylsulfatase A-like enzyme
LRPWANKAIGGKLMTLRRPPTAIGATALAIALALPLMVATTTEPSVADPAPVQRATPATPTVPDQSTIDLHTGRPNPPGQAPNLLFISIDDLRMFDGAIGHPQAITPNIDRLRAEGMWFPNATSDSMICGPSRVSLLFGLRPTSTGIDSHAENEMDYAEPTRGHFADPTSAARVNYGDDIASITSLFERFDATGRYVGYAGKVSHSDTHSGYEQAKNVFDFYQPFTASRVQAYDEFDPDNDGHPVHGYDDIIAAKNHRTDWGVLSEIDPINQTEPYVEADTTNHIMKTHALQMLDEAGSDPFFISVGFTQPHLPLYVPDRFEAMYRLENLGQPIDTVNFVRDDRLDLAHPRGGRTAIQRALFSRYDRTQEFYRHYLAAITQVDEYIGDILDKLDALGLSDTTNIVLWSDHGYHLGEKQKLGKSMPYWVTTNIPLVIKAPGVTTPGSTTDALVNSVDLFPTMLDLVGLDQPTDFQRDGRSLMRLLADPDTPWPFAATASFTFPDNPLSDSVVFTADGWSYLEYQHDPMEPYGTMNELYDIDDDPDQLINLLSSYHNADPSAQQPMVDDLRAQMSGQSQPQAPPSVLADTVDIDPSGPTAVWVDAADPNVDALTVSFPELASDGQLFTSLGGEPDQLIEAGVLYDGSRVLNGQLLYLPDNPSSPVDDQLTVAVSDGIDVAQAPIDLVVRANSDADNVADHIEDAGPNGGDANADGVPDSLQGDVVTFINPNHGQYNTVEIIDGRCPSITRVDFSAQPAVLPAPFVNGLPELVIECRRGAGRARATIGYTHHRFYDPADHRWYLYRRDDASTAYMSNAVWTEIDDGNGQLRTVVEFELIDGRPRDLDGRRNSVIVHQSGVYEFST